MSKNKTKQTVVETPESDAVVEGTEEPTFVAKTPRELKEAIETRREALDLAIARVAELESDLSDAIKDLRDNMGKGPFLIAGRTVTIMHRSDSETGKILYFFKSVGGELKSLDD